MAAAAKRQLRAGGKDGLGLGLNVCYNIVQRMAGSLQVGTSPSGTKFSFTLALDLPTKEELEAFIKWGEAGAAAGRADPSLPPSQESTVMLQPPPVQGSLARQNGLDKERWESMLACKAAESQVVVDSSVDTSGSTATAGTASAAKEAAAAPAVPVGLANSTPPRILVVDDNGICQRVARHVLKGLGCTIDVASNGKIAVEKVKENPDIYDLILMDLRMPIMDGIEPTSLIREDLKQTAVPILGFAAEIGPDVKDMCLSACMTGFLPKPANKQSMAAALAEHGLRSCKWRDVTW